MSEDGAFSFTAARLLAVANDIDGDGLFVTRMFNVTGGAITTGAGGTYIFAAKRDVHIRWRA